MFLLSNFISISFNHFGISFCPIIVTSNQAPNYFKSNSILFFYVIQIKLAPRFRKFLYPQPNGEFISFSDELL